MEFIELSDALRPEWDAFCDQNADAWFWHTSSFLEYQRLYRPAFETNPKHLAIRRDNRLIAICPLAIERLSISDASYLAFSLGGDSLPAPVLSDQLQTSDRNRVMKALLDQIDKLASQEGIQRISYRYSTLTPRFLTPGIAPANELVGHDYLDWSWQTQILDLRRPVPELWANVRQSYRSPIRRAGENFTFCYLDQSSITPESFECYRELHHRAAGRVTRPLETFRLMFDWIKTGQAVLSQVLQESRVVAATIINLYKSRAYYGSACEDPTLAQEWPLSHFLQWRLIEALKERGVTHYELGWQFFSPQIAYIPTAEEQQIAFFKRGFGGHSVPLISGRKYYNPDLMQRELIAQVDALGKAQRAALASQ